MLDSFTAQKIIVRSDDFKKKIGEVIHPSCLEERFGGTLPNKTENFFPPDMSSPIEGERMLTIA